MANPAEKKTIFTVEEYFKIEEESEIRHEYLNGELFAMAGGSDIHNEIVNNTFFSLRSNLTIKSSGCKIYTENVKLELQKDQYYVYPDLMLTCNQEDSQERYFKRNPLLIVEVLSPSTLSYDKGGKKFHHYLKIPSLEYYLLISQEEVRVECFSRVENGQGWYYQVFESLGARILFKKLGMEINLKDIYQGIEIAR